ncbi:MAG: nucleotidyltransferase family protein [Litorimonas sp.]
MTKAVLILAGQRDGVVDPLCEEAGVSHKAEIPIAGIPMLNRVVSALGNAGLSEKLYISGYSKSGLKQVSSGKGPADSVALGLEEINEYPCLVTTCDHALLTEGMIQSFTEGAEAAGTDICVGLATETVIQAEYPETKRTYLRFADEAVSGCNLFYIANEEGLKAIAFWQSVQHLRKNPLKLARKVGVGIGIKYAAGRLTLKGAFDYAADRIGITAAPVLLPFAEAAIDVDKPSDLELVETILRMRAT